MFINRTILTAVNFVHFLKGFYMSDIKKHWLGTMNNIVNSYNAEWNECPIGSRITGGAILRVRSKIIDTLAKGYSLAPQIIEEIIAEHEYGYIDANDVDLGEKLGIDNPEWEHKPEAFLIFKAVHQLFAHDHHVGFEMAGGYKSW